MSQHPYVDPADEFLDDEMVRCPKCGDQQPATDRGLHTDGTFRIECEKCDHEFVVDVQISRTYVSPPMEGHEDGHF